MKDVFVTDSIRYIGVDDTTIDLFDYWITTRTAPAAPNRRTPSALCMPACVLA